MAMLLKDKILEVLKVRDGFDIKKFNAALKLQKEKGGSLGKILVESGVITRRDLIFILGGQLNIASINLKRYRLDLDLVKTLPENVMRDHKVIPVSKIGNVLTVALADPFDVFAVDRLKAMTGCDIQMVLALGKERRSQIVMRS